MRYVNSRKVVVLGADKFLITEFSGFVPSYGLDENDTTLSEATLALYDRAESALENPPRTDFRRNLKLFAPLRKGMSIADVVSYVGKSDEFYEIGYGAIATYDLLNGTTLTLRYAKRGRRGTEGEDWLLESITGKSMMTNGAEEFLE